MKRKDPQDPQEERLSRASGGKILKSLKRKDPQDPKNLKRKNLLKKSLEELSYRGSFLFRPLRLFPLEALEDRST